MGDPALVQVGDGVDEREEGARDGGVVAQVGAPVRDEAEEVPALAPAASSHHI